MEEDSNKILTASEVAEALRVSVGWVYRQSRLGKLPSFRLGGALRFRRASIEALIERLESEAAA